MIFSESPLRDAWRLWAWGPWRALLGTLPAGVELEANRHLGVLAAKVGGETRRRVEANLRRAFPHRDDIGRIAGETFEAHFAHQYLPMSFPRITTANASQYLRIEGLHHLSAAMDGGRGVVLMHPHMGPVQLPLCVMGVMGYPLNQIGGGVVTGLSPTGRWAARTRHGLEGSLRATVHDGRRYLGPVVRALKAGGVVMATCDGTGGGEELGRRAAREVLGHPMQVPLGPPYLALRGDAALLTLVTRRHRGGGAPWVTTIGPELRLQRGAPLRAGLSHGADLVAGFLEETLAAWPGDWHFWDHFEPGRFILPAEVAA